MAKNKIRLEFNSQGFAQILASEGCHDLVQSVAEDVAARANANSGLDSFVANSVKAPTRYIAFASTSDKASMIAESENKALTGALR